MSLLAPHQCRSSLLANLCRVFKERRANQSVGAVPILEGLAKFLMIPYLSQLSLRGQSSLLWLPGFIIIKPIVPIEELIKEVKQQIYFFLLGESGAEMTWQGMLLAESFEWEKHRLLATRRNNNTPDGCPVESEHSTAQEVEHVRGRLFDFRGTKSVA